MRLDAPTDARAVPWSMTSDNAKRSSTAGPSFDEVFDADAMADSVEPPASPSRSAPDFRNATRQEVFDWMNEQIVSGEMTLDQSHPFLLMTVKVSVADGRPVEMATDSTRMDFVARAKDGIDGALFHHDYEAAERLRAAVALMERVGSE